MKIKIVVNNYKSAFWLGQKWQIEIDISIYYIINKYTSYDNQMYIMYNQVYII